MADLAEAPEPPTGWVKPPGHLALRCQFCLCWSTMKTPFTHHRAKQCKFYPLIAWYQGSRENPVGFICLICVNVHASGGWKNQIGGLRQCAAYFKSNPTKLHPWNAQRAKLIELRNENPDIRIRTAEQLGVKTLLGVEEKEAETLVAPLAFFVEVSTYTLMKKQPPPEANLEYKKFQGNVLTGVTVCGREWLMAWEDGMRGVYRAESASGVAVSKFHEVMNNDEPALVDNLLNDTHAHYAKKLLAGTSSLPTNDPSMSRASKLLGIGSLLGDDSDDEGVSQPAKVPKLTDAPQQPSASPQPAPLPDGPDDDCLFNQIRPQPATASCAGKAKAKPAAKGKASAKAKGKATAAKAGGKSKARPPVPLFSEVAPEPVKEEEQQQEQPAKRLRISPIESVDPSLSGTMANHMAESDKQWQDDVQVQFEELLKMNPRAPDNEFRSDMQDLVKSAGTLLASIRAKIRSAKRRSEENKASLMKFANTMLENCAFVSDFMKELCKEGNPGSGDSLHSQFTSLLSQKAIFGVEIVKRVAKRLLVDDISFQRWVKITKTTWTFVNENMAPDVREKFFFQQLTVAMQKLVKGIDVNKVSHLDYFGDPEADTILQDTLEAMPASSLPDATKGDDLGSDEGSDSEPLGPPRVDTDGHCDPEALATYISQLLSAYPRTDKMYEDVSAIMAAQLLQYHNKNPESNVFRNLASMPAELSIGSGCTGTGAFKVCVYHGLQALQTVFSLQPSAVDVSFACECVPFKQLFSFAHMEQQTELGTRPCMFNDITSLTDDEKRVCVTHESDCALPSQLDAFGAGFSCTSYSMLNADAKHNATAMHRATKQGTSNPDDEVQSVSTFQGCVDIRTKCKPLWALFENVQTIDREVDAHTQTNLEICLQTITDLGYSCQSYLLDSSWYGLPQSRRRVYIICISNSHPDLSCSATEFFKSVKTLLHVLQFPSPPAEQFLLEDDHPAVKNYLAYLQAEREAQKKREAATGDTKIPAWISLHMQVAEKRSIVWPLAIPPELNKSAFFYALTDRTKEVVAFANDDRTRSGRPINFADVYHSANRYSVGTTALPICLPRSQVWCFSKGRLILGREALVIQGHSVEDDLLNGLEAPESSFQDLAGNSYSGNVLLAAILAVLCSLRFTSESEAEENMDIVGMLQAMAGHRSSIPR